MNIVADQNPIKIGFCSNIQDQTVIHTSDTTSPGLASGTSVGDYVTVGRFTKLTRSIFLFIHAGHGCTLYSCTIESNCLIGMGSTVLDGALVEKNSILGAGTVVPPGRLIPSGQMWTGNPAQYVREVSEDEVCFIVFFLFFFFHYFKLL